MTAIYLDASAIVKLAADEAESLALGAWLKERSSLVTSRLSTVEVARAVGRKGAADEARGRAAVKEAFKAVAVVELDASIADHAVTLPPRALRALDAIHLATALSLHGELDAFVTYDGRLADAARAAGLEVVAPA